MPAEVAPVELQAVEAPDAGSASLCGQPPPDEYVLLYDRTHQAMSRGVCWSVDWFDQFFASPDALLDEPATTLVRLIGAHRWQDDGDIGDEVRVRASVNLPNLSNRLSLTFRNDDDPDDDFATTADTRPEQVGDNEDNTFRAALNWAARQRERDSIDLEVGIRSEFKTFTRARYRLRLPLPGDKWDFRFTETVYWIDGTGLGTESRFEFGRPLTTRTALRLTTEAEHNEDMQERELGWDLSQAAVLFLRLNSRTALQYSVSAQGFSDPSTNVDVWRTSLRYRRNFFRRWLFFEIEPFVFWPRIDDYSEVNGVVLRLETQFGVYEPLN
ncbi:MAG: hypothetical protein P1U78_07105 [Alcanivoracaceae bacterium]|nr:hypothetical protein [Alcanivoracaceae bacterium]